MVVVDEVRIPLVRLGAEEAVEALEAAAERPVLLGRGDVHLVLGAEMPLADDVGVPAALAEDLGDHRALAGDVAARVREPRRRLGDARHRVRRVVAARQEAGARRRAERRRVEVRVQQPAVGDPLDVRRLDQARRTTPSPRSRRRRGRRRARSARPPEAIGWAYGSQSGAESLMSMLIVPLNGLLISVSFQPPSLLLFLGPSPERRTRARRA